MPCRGVALIGLLFAGNACAQSSLFWETGATGIWDTSTPNWSLTQGGIANQTWSNAGTAGVADEANFNAGGGTVTLAADVTASQVVFGSDSYTLDGAHPLTLTDAASINSSDGVHTIEVVIAGSAGLTKTGTGTIQLGAANTYTGVTTVRQGTLRVASSGSITTSNATDFFYAGEANGDDGTLEIASGGALVSYRGYLGFASGSSGTADLAGTWTMSGNLLYVGYDGTGALSVQTGGTMTNVDSYLGRNSGGSGTADITGTWNNSGELVVGRSGTGALTVQSGGTVTSARGWIGRDSGSSGTADIAGTWNNSGNLYVGYEGTGALTVQSGGTVTNDIGRLGSNSSSSGTANIAGTWTNSGDLYVNSGTLTIENGGLVQVEAGAGTVYLGSTDTSGTLNITGSTTAGVLNAATVRPGGSGTAILNFNHSDSSYVFTNTGTAAGTAIAITGNVSVNHLGSGSTTLPGANTYTGDTTISAGTLILGHTDALQGSTLTTGSGLSFGALTSATFGGLSGSENLALTNDSAGAVALSIGANDTSTTYSGSLSGSGSLTKTGTGTLTFAGAHTHTGNTTISAGTLRLVSGGSLSDHSALTVASGTIFDLNGQTDTVGSLAGAGNVTLGDGALTVGANNDSTGFSGGISGSGTLTKTGSGTQVLSGTNTYTGATTVSAGTLQFAQQTALYNNTPASWTADNLIVAAGATAAFNVGGSGEFTIAEIATLAALGTDSGGFKNGAALGLDTTNAGGDVTYGSVIANPDNNRLGLTKLGSGTLILTATNTYSGGTTINAGTLQIGAGDNTGTLGFGDVTNNAALVYNRWGDYEFSRSISGPGTLTLANSGTLSLSNTNSYTGATTISAGTLRLLSGGSLSSSTALSVASGARFDLNGRTDTIGSLAGAGSVTLGSVIFGGGALTVGANDDSTDFSGSISEEGTLTKTGAGTFTLSGTNTYTGSTTIREGTLLVAASGSIATTGEFWTGNSSKEATLQVASGGSVANTNGYLGSTSNSSGTAEIAGTWTNSGTVIVGQSGTGVLTIEDGGKVQVNAGVGTVTLAYNSGSSGTLNITGSTAAGVLNAATVNGRNGTATLNFNHSDSDYAFTTDGTAAGTAIAITGSIALNHLGAGTTTLTGTNTYTGATTISAGTLRLSSGGSLPDSTALTVASGATLDLNGQTDTIGSLTGAGSVTLGSGALTTGGNQNSTVFSGGISGAGTLTKSGAGNLTLTGTNSYTGTTSVSAGTLTFASTTASATVDIETGATLALNVPSGTRDNGADITFTGAGTLAKTGDGTATWGVKSATFHLASGALLDIQAGTFTGGSSANEVWTDNLADLNVAAGATFAGTEANVRVDALSGDGTIRSGYNGAGYTAFTFGVDNGSGTFSGVLADTSGSRIGNFIKEGSGTQTLSGANTYTGTTTVSAGTLRIGTGGSLSDTTALTVASGATFDLNGQTDTIGSLAGGGDVTLGSGALTTGGDDGDTAFSGGVSGAGTLTKIGTGTLTLSGANTYTGTTTVSAGTLTLAGTTASATLDIATGATLDLNVASGTRDNGAATTFTGTGILAKTGNGIAIWGVRAATFSLGSGALLDIQAGTFTGGSSANEVWTDNLADLNVAAGATFAGTEANVRVDALTGDGTIRSGYNGAGYAAFTFGVDNGSGTFSGVLANTSGSHIGNFIKEGSGTQTLSGANTYTGTTSIDAGTLQLGANAALVSTCINVNSGATFDVSAISDGFALASSQTLAGAGTINGLVTLSAGATLAPGNSPGTLTFTDGLTLNSGTIIDLELGTLSDHIRVTGGTLAGPGIDGGITLNLTDSGGFTPGVAYTFLDATGASSLTSIGATSFAIGTGISGYSFSLSQLGSTFQLTATSLSAVPEPSTWAALVGLLMLGFAAWRRLTATRTGSGR